MKSLFRGFDRAHVDYLLISGQASILYGAATFSEDVDLWIRPSRTNLRRLLVTLARHHARVHKLTPPMTLPYAAAGHGFHFVLPTKPLPTYLDVMARAPRVGDFTAAAGRARRMATDWGTLPVVSIEDLVLLKKTRRLSDYEVISNLARLRLAEAIRPSRRLLRWAASNSFRAEDRASFLARLGERASVEACRRAIAHDVLRLQARDVAYWRPRIDALRKLRGSGRLWPEGKAV